MCIQRTDVVVLYSWNDTIILSTYFKIPQTVQWNQERLVNVFMQYFFETKYKGKCLFEYWEIEADWSKYSGLLYDYTVPYVE